jgi:hypothetical protein
MNCDIGSLMTAGSPSRDLGNVEHPHHAVDVFAVCRIVIGEAPRAAVDRLPASQDLAVECAWLEA